jgi:hypothetical protein
MAGVYAPRDVQSANTCYSGCWLTANPTTSAIASTRFLILSNGGEGWSRKPREEIKNILFVRISSDRPFEALPVDPGWEQMLQSLAKLG